MKIPTTQQLPEKSANAVAEDGEFVTIDLNSYEKDIGVCQAPRQDLGSKPVRSHKTMLVILILVLVSVATLTLVVALSVYLSREQKL